METKKNLAYIDALRILAILLVLLNHLPAVTVYPLHEGLSRWAFLLLTLFDRINVPVFFMISGALLLSKEESFSTLLKKRILRFFLVLLLFSLGIFAANALIAVLHKEEPVLSLWEFCKAFLSSGLKNADSYWFLYAYLSLLLMLPFLRPAMKAVGTKEYLMLLILHILSYSVLPLINLFCLSQKIDTLGFSRHLSIPFASLKPFFYAITGCLLARADIKKIRPKTLLLLCLAALGGMILSASCTLLYASLHGEYTENYYEMFDYLTAIVVFLLIRYGMTEGFPSLSEGKFAKALRHLSPLSFGIYLLDPFLKMSLYPTYTRLFGAHAEGLLFSLGWVFASFLLGGLLTFLLKKLPLIRRLL